MGQKVAKHQSSITALSVLFILSKILRVGSTHTLSSSALEPSTAPGIYPSTTHSSPATSEKVPLLTA